MTMKTYFVDTSALFKRYIPEEGSAWMDRLFDEDARMLVSTLARVEVASNLQRLLSVDSFIDRRQFTAAWAAFFMDLATGRLEAVGVTSGVVDGAVHLLMDTYITPMDALQISSAMSMGEGVVVVSSDQRLNKTLSTLGIQHIDPARQPAPG